MTTHAPDAASPAESEPPIAAVASGSAKQIFGAQLFVSALNLAVSPQLARALEPEGRGHLAIIQVYNDASTALFNGGVPQSVGYYAREDRRRAASLIGTTLLYSLLMLPVSIVVGIIVTTWLLPDLGLAVSIAVLWLIGASPLINTVGNSCANLVGSAGDFIGSRNHILISGTMRAVLLGVAAFAGSLSLLVATLAYVFGAAIGGIYALFRVGAGIARPYPLRPVLTFGIRAMPGTLASFANTRLDQLVIVPLLGAADLGLYAVAVGLNFIIVQLGAALSRTVLHRMGTSNTDEALERGSAALRRTLLACIFTAIMLAVGSLIFFVPLFGRAFEPALEPLLLLLPGSIAYGLFLVQLYVLIALGRPGAGSAVQLGGLLTLVVLLGTLVPLFGLTGAAIGTSTAYIVRSLIAYAVLRKAGVRRFLPRLDDARELFAPVHGVLARLRFR